jgi:lambda family phage portal protein
MNSSYHAASQARRMSGWYAPGTGPNAAMNANVATLRNRSRAEQRNNPWAARALSSLMANEIGTGITPHSRAENKDLRSGLDELWRGFVPEIDPEGILDAYGQQGLAAMNRRMSGDVFLRRRRRSLAEGFTVPMQVQILESEFVPETLHKKLPNGNRIYAGIEFNRRGQRVAYMMHREHPGDPHADFDFGKLLRIPAADVIHHFRPVRPGQVRGIPGCVQGLVKAKGYDKYDDAELRRKEQRAPYTGFLYREPYEQDYKFDPITGAPIKNELGENGEPPSVDVEGGVILTGEIGEKLQLFDGDNTGQGYADYQWMQKMAIAAGFDVPYELMSGDWSRVNDRLVRAILNEFHRQLQMDIENLDVHQVCNGVRRWFIEAVVIAGYDLPSYADNYADWHKVEWRPQAWPYVHPLQDVQAKIKKIDAGLSSRQSEIGKDGTQSAEEIDRQNAEDEKRIIDERKNAGLGAITE